MSMVRFAMLCDKCSARPAKVEVNGKWYCHIHDPKAVEKRKSAQRAKWDEQTRRSQALHRREKAERAAVSFLQIIVDGFTYDPGHSDLDNEQPISVRMTLGDYRRASNLLYEVKKSV